MNDLSSERVEPAARVNEPPALEPRGQSESVSRRRRSPPRDDSDLAESLETPAHQVDRMAQGRAAQTMDQELSRSRDLMERRVALMRDLAGLLEQAQSAVVRSDLAGITGATALQRVICEALNQLEAEALRQAARSAGGDESRDPNSGMPLRWEEIAPHRLEQWKTLSEEVSQAELRVRRLNLAYGALLRRARRTVQIYACVLASSANTYSRPKVEPSIGPQAFQEISHV